MIVESPTDLIHGNCFLRLDWIAEHFRVHLKLEGLSATGSIKLKPAARMVGKLESLGLLFPGAGLVESSSGNLGLALSMICAARRYRFTCVTDPNITPQAERIMRAYGANVEIVRERDSHGGYLGTRIDLIRSMLEVDPSLVWVNQYENGQNIEAHYETTGQEILRQFPQPDYVFVGAGTTGTLGGVSKRLAEDSPRTKVIAVDTAGSVTFGGAPGRRHIPGLGTSRAPKIREFSRFDELLMVREEDAVRMCLRAAKKGVLLGGSSGTVLCAVESMSSVIEPGAVVVAISPDMGDRYMDSIYDPAWVRRHFPQLDPVASLATQLT